MKPNVMLAYLHPGHVRHEFVKSLLLLMKESNEEYDLSYVDTLSGPLISSSRNMVLELFLQGTYTHLLWVDSDIVFKPEYVKKLLDDDKDIVGGLYYNLSPQRLYQGLWTHVKDYGFPVALTKDDTGNYHTLDSVPELGVHPVDALGMGFTLVRREVIETLGVDREAMWPYAEATMEGHAAGEDVTFCLRAKEKGFTTWLDVEVMLGHMKTVVIGLGRAEEA